MTKFRYNVTNARNHSEKIRSKLDLYKNLNEKIFMDLESLKNCWTDSASEAFLKKVYKDKEECINVCQSLNLYQKNIEDFTEELGNLFSREGYSTDNMDIFYDSSLTNSIYSSFNSLKNRADDADRAIYDCVIPSTIAGWCLDLINDVYHGVHEIQWVTPNLRDNIEGMGSRVKGLVEGSTSKVYSIAYNEMNNDVLTVSYSIQSIVSKLLPELSSSKVSNVSPNSSKMSAEYGDANLNEYKEFVMDSVNPVEVDEEIDIKSKLVGTSFASPSAEKQSAEYGDANLNKYKEFVMDSVNPVEVDEEIDIESKLAETTFASPSADKQSAEYGDANLNEYKEFVMGSVSPVDVDDKVYNESININADDLSKIKYITIETEKPSINTSMYSGSTNKNTNLGNVKKEPITFSANDLKSSENSNIEIGQQKQDVMFNSDLSLIGGKSINLESASVEGASLGNMNLQSSSNSFELSHSNDGASLGNMNLEQSSHVDYNDIIDSIR